MSLYTFQPFDIKAIAEVSSWQYTAPYDVYNLDPLPIDNLPQSEIAYYLHGDSSYYKIMGSEGAFIGFCSFGPDGPGAGGDYRTEALDIGMGLRPDLTGQKFGTEILPQVLNWAATQFNHKRFRVTIAAFNLRAQALVTHNGFGEVATFKSAHNGKSFKIFVR